MEIFEILTRGQLLKEEQFDGKGQKDISGNQ